MNNEMANRRMFSLDVVDTDIFLDMPASSQNLYFHLGMRADDDGFVSSPRKITKLVNCSRDDLNVLISRGFVIAFADGIVVITHWRQNNYIQKDRYKETVYKNDLESLSIENGVYRLDTVRIQSGNNLEAQVSIGKDSIVENKTYSCAFEEFWKAYPRKKEKSAAYKAYKATLNKGFSEDELMTAVKRYAEECKKEQRESRYIKLCSTFLGPNTPFMDYLNQNEEKHASVADFYSQFTDLEG